MNETRTIRIEVDEAGIATLTLDRPEVRNAIDLEMIQELTASLASLAVDPRVRVLILKGAGDKAFAGGADIAQLRERRTLEALQQVNARLFQQLEDFPHPTIAAIEGFALGGGCELALACDLRVAGETAKLGFPEVGLGIFPAAGGTHRLPKLVGLGKAKELVFTGRIVGAAQSLELGLVEHVTPAGGAEARARELAAEIAKNGGLAVRIAKLAFNAIARGNDPEPIEKLGQAILFESQDKLDRMGAFLEKRKKKENQG
ncbi:enoyl-CoA hydratase/isomerase family protein [Vulgatibacter incomptus]|uniref:Enoyl-CoA hydratase n=1 Tax=Vulgatibacter incomptus TaxID=1391653 RepID=A0A0K1P965_9BACT|nr:enoyl-CoA hydratase-related protein [Vulgatibacter incomptus]AKU90078.1 Enoyl-CoA hydratase [Vulgatibacter incomptus]